MVLESLFRVVMWVFFLWVGWKLAKFLFRTIQRRRILKRMSKSGIRDIDQMDGFQFEFYLVALFNMLGYRPAETQQSHDYGADLVLKGRNKIVIQAKRYKFKNRVGIDAVQQVYAAQAYYKAQESWVITNSRYTSGAKNLAKACGVKLLDRVELQEFINKVNPEVKAADVYHQVEPEARVCPECGQALVVRHSRDKGSRFFGCTSFPQCRHTEQINA
ncbi:restriction endonuclease [Alkalicoccobacillus gibsonii]|uniref:restriction endonuclease n=1 Tax=Alkalicoccobacillus gibsonii TaxID=79881 RepID=UPI00193136D4|nr:restriction endonuclease [Alkalicoccobacillus gibsonii]MBM0067945.1 restriction endonuclease [Alkalicoccobacillus gibsonii]